MKINESMVIVIIDTDLFPIESKEQIRFDEEVFF